MYQPLIINFTPTGMIPTKKESPYVPISSNEIVEQVHEANELGITMVHLHARDSSGLPSHRKSDFTNIVEGVRKFCPELVLGVSLSGRNVTDIAKRAEPLELYPDMGSLTLGSLNFPKSASVNSPETILSLLDHMENFGVNPELEVFDMGMVNYAKFLIKKEKLRGLQYFNILLGNLFNQQADMAQAGLLLKELPENCVWSMAGIGAEQLKANTWAITQGGGVRVGLEDNLWFNSSRTKLASNIDLIKRIHEIADIFERPVMAPKYLGEMGFYNSKRINK